ncbi:DUF4157 domain-containing protein (plasmid) [Nostoc sp. UHCC 0302]
MTANHELVKTMHKTKLSKTDSSIYSNSLSPNSHSQLAYRPFASQPAKVSSAAKTSTDIEDVAFAEQQMEATGLEIQAKYGKITPEGQERLTVLQAKMDGLLNSRLSHATQFGHNIANIPLLRPQTSTPIQAKLTIGEPGDKYEQEADETARQVVQRIHQSQGEKVQRESLLEEEELQMKPERRIQRESLPLSEDELQMKPMVQRVADGGMATSPDLETSIQQARGSGQPLADSIKSPMEQAFGADFSGVKVHTDTRADQLNQSIQAKAFTTGQDVFFRQGAYQPGSRDGQELLAHELTHVVQQKANTERYVVGKTERSGSDARIQRMMMSSDTTQKGKNTPEKSEDKPNMIKTILEEIAKEKGFSLQELEMRTYAPKSMMMTYLYAVESFMGGENLLKEMYEFIKQDQNFTAVCGHTSQMSFPAITENKSEEKGTGTDNLIEFLKSDYEGLVRVDNKQHSFTIEATKTSMRIYQSNAGEYSLAQRIDKDKIYKREDFIDKLETALKTDDSNNPEGSELFGERKNYTGVNYQYKKQTYEANVGMVSENIKQQLKEHEKEWNKVQESEEKLKDYCNE